MKVVYNGIEFDIIQLHSCDCEYVYDDSGIDYLYTHFNLNLTCMINGQAEVREIGGPPLSYVQSDAPPADFNPIQDQTAPKGATPTPIKTVKQDDPNRKRGGIIERDLEAGNPYRVGEFRSPMFSGEERKAYQLVRAPAEPALSHRVVRARLSQPRGRLYVFAGEGDRPDELLLQSPNGFELCDAKGGPTCKVFNITGARGDGNFLFADLQVETFVRETFPTNENPFLLSNRWTTTHSVDQDSFTTVTVQGTAVFDLAKLMAQAAPSGYNADSWRPFLFQPIAHGFERTGIQVMGSEDGAVLNYTYQDRQLSHFFTAGPYAEATQISAVHTQTVNCDTDALTTAVTIHDSIQQSRLNQRWLREQREKDEARAAIEANKNRKGANSALIDLRRKKTKPGS